jgi:hypothetical protein
MAAYLKKKVRHMSPSRFLILSGVLSGAIGLVVSASGAAQAATTSPCGGDGTAGTSSCAYTTVGPGTFVVPADVHRAYFTVAGASDSAARGNELIARLNVLPGETFRVNVGGSNLATQGSGVSVGSAGHATEVLAAAGGQARGATGYVTTGAASYRAFSAVHSGNGEVTVSWEPDTSVPPLPPVPTVPVPSVGVLATILAAVGSALSGVIGLVTGLLG